MTQVLDVTQPKNGSRQKSRLHWGLLVFLTSLLFTVALWERYFNSTLEIERSIIGNIILVMGGLFSVMAGWLTHSIESHRASLENEVRVRAKALIEERDHLQKALSEIKVLRGFIPICASCHKIRDVSGEWQRMEKYWQEHTEIRFSHGICKECAQKALEQASSAQ